MRRAVRDDAAIAFSTGFYDGLGCGLSIEEAFDLGCNAIQFELASFSAAPRSFTVIPVDFVEADPEPETLTDDRIPILLKRKTPPTENQTHASPSDISLSEKIRTEDTSRSDAVKQYQAQVKVFLADSDQTSAKVFQLALLATRLGLSEMEANRILEEERNSSAKSAKRSTGIYPQPPLDVPAPISEAALQIALSHNLSRWRREVSVLPENSDKVRVELFRQFQFDSFLDAIDFMNQVALDCEFSMHHPRWENTWKTLNVYLTSWDIGHQISDRDVQLAKGLEQAFDSFSGATIAIRKATRKAIYPMPPPELPVPIDETTLNMVLDTNLSHWKKVVSPLPEDSSHVRVELFRRYRFKSFLDAIAFMHQVAPRCERAMHHPRWENIWRTLNVYFTTWDIGHQISDRDLQSAKAFDQVFATFPGAKL
jgi:pterin-4a-carbinolamine dehydratase